MKIGEWEFMETRRDVIQDPPRVIEMIFYDCTHTSGLKIARSFTAIRPIDDAKYEEFLKFIADEMSQQEFVRRRIQQ